MTIATIKARLALLLPLVDGSNTATADADPPNSISPGAGPAWIILPGADVKDTTLLGDTAEFSPGVGAYVSKREWKLMLAVGALGSGGPGDLPAQCTPFLDGFGPFFKARPHLADPATGLGPLDNIIHCEPGDDTGVTGIEWGNTTYVGVVFPLSISEILYYTFVAGE